MVILVLFLVSCGQGTPKKALAIENENLEEIVTVEDETLAVQATNPISPLVEEVEGLDIHKGIKKALLSKLYNAKEDFENGYIADAIEKLRAFINHVEAQSGKKIKDSNTSDLITMVEAIIKALPIEVAKIATPSEVTEPGGDVIFEVTINNESSVDAVTISSLVDNIHGDLNGQEDCAVPQTIVPDDNYSCSFTVFVGGNAGESETDTITATGRRCPRECS